jgi:hypothetical protein
MDGIGMPEDGIERFFSIGPDPELNCHPRIVVAIWKV